MRLLSLSEVFCKPDPGELLDLLAPTADETMGRDCDELCWMNLRSVILLLLGRLVIALQCDI